jgi:hypothetical protein
VSGGRMHGAHSMVYGSAVPERRAVGTDEIHADEPPQGLRRVDPVRHRPSRTDAHILEVEDPEVAVALCRVILRGPGVL